MMASHTWIAPTGGYGRWDLRQVLSDDRRWQIGVLKSAGKEGEGKCSVHHLWHMKDKDIAY